MISRPETYRVLVIDDNQSILNDYRKILAPHQNSAELASLEENLFAKPADPFQTHAIYRSQLKQRLKVWKASKKLKNL